MPTPSLLGTWNILKCMTFLVHTSFDRFRPTCMIFCMSQEKQDLKCRKLVINKVSGIKIHCRCFAQVTHWIYFHKDFFHMRNNGCTFFKKLVIVLCLCVCRLLYLICCEIFTQFLRLRRKKTIFSDKNELEFDYATNFTLVKHVKFKFRIN